ncbi:DUF4235 domain-containing protein [Bifidobacterium gallicum]|uniref:Membrane associated protein n=1 Tax=Bifidobacterium gallicum DSM 20093 = LMG 11596 TaxID=561180 RepID=D1NX01_9BIFI|nr:DUF4235 domain-containing protein [Bifidobacterium gallicum]EFA22061.1 hypothetical protein BIFGAL_04409 [Bifidobacterium gallicum DSM 20093 = LMG 11596]KFI59361.1 membrane associated protein [Bifidobacterium gallicum DSM 20093 = LMG 11596]
MSLTIKNTRGSAVAALDKADAKLVKADAEASHQEQGLSSTAGNVINSLHKVDNKVNGLAAARRRDPDTLGDKIAKSAVPSLAGMAAGRIFQTVWDRIMDKIHPSPVDDEQDHKTGIIGSLVFAALSAAFVAVVTQLSDRGTIAAIHKMQSKRKKR